ncbi:type 4a pilus biogenesis protein PilO [Paraburkholderia antibiotica]|uniref:Type 4a pilus biogenesis protein PilO n=1 Tax=Paraburkholderia antibiotica TaxID=2728839 RepID=A0A7X9X935_9BURK|nr:type 4a pilus biogenesis protein PilO [Paraburkholderia antibiotica]NML33766.1 type 4a pilus biogenesis protein PilO [Paraburkholderia antibiotica]
MSTTFFAPVGMAPTSAGVSRWLRRARLPLEAWSGRRRWTVAALLATLVFGVGAYGWSTADMSGLDASRAALAASMQRLADAQHALAQLPSLRREAATLSATFTAAASATMPWRSADDVRIVSELATQSGVALLAVEPGTASGEGIERMRPLQLTARTDFVHLMAFFHGLTQLPVLIVPVDVTVRQDGGALTMSATLRVFDALRPVPEASQTNAGASLDADEADDDDEDEDVVFFDPFAKPQMSAGDVSADAVQWRLVGLLRDRTRGLALLDTPDGATTVATGQQLGVERVTQLDAQGITLANGGATRTLTLMEAS